MTVLDSRGRGNDDKTQKQDDKTEKLTVTKYLMRQKSLKHQSLISDEGNLCHVRMSVNTLVMGKRILRGLPVRSKPAGRICR